MYWKISLRTQVSEPTRINRVHQDRRRREGSLIRSSMRDGTGGEMVSEGKGAGAEREERSRVRDQVCIDDEKTTDLLTCDCLTVPRICSSRKFST